MSGLDRKSMLSAINRTNAILFGPKSFSRAHPGISNKPNPNAIDKDYVGPVDMESNLRLYVRCIKKNETNLTTRLREKRLEVENWNRNFWSTHNKRFYEEKEDFTRLHKIESNSDARADEMSQFYKSFLDKNWKIHLLYNLSWYIKNFELLFLAFKVETEAIFIKLRRPFSKK